MLPKYLSWHYRKTLKKLFSVYIHVIIFVFYYFSIPHHVKTLVNPWKRQKITSRRIGFNLSEYLGDLSFNIISRSVGAVIRSMTILSGIIVLFVTEGIGFVALALFVVTPFLWIPIFLVQTEKTKSITQRILESSGHDLKLLISKMVKTDEGTFILSHIGLLPHDIAAKIHASADQGNFQYFWDLLMTNCPDTENITVGNIIATLSQTYGPFSAMISENDISIHDVEEASRWYYALTHFAPVIRLTDLNSLLRIPGIGRDWSYGYTPDLEKYTRDLRLEYEKYPNVIGRKDEIQTLERVLSKTNQNSAILVGESGVGRHVIVYALAKLIEQGLCLPTLSTFRVLRLDLKAALAGKDQISGKFAVGVLLKEAKAAGNIILVIDAIDQYLTNSNNSVNLNDTFAEVLSDGKLQIIGITDPASYHQLIIGNTAISSFAEIVKVSPPAHETVLRQLELSIAPVLEKKYSIVFTIQSLHEAIKDSDQYVSDNPFPEKAIELLDETAVFIISEKKKKVIEAQDVQEFLTLKTNIPIGKVTEREKIKLSDLEAQLHKFIINQQHAIETISESLKRGRMLVSNLDRPIGSFLFLGPTGVGKTETAKALARIYFGDEHKLLRFDMAQYQNEGLERLIGSFARKESGSLTDKIKENPFSLVLFDEIEKADKKIFNILLTLLEDGYIEDVSGKKINARNTIIIATSNAGSEFIREQILKGIKGQELEKQLIDYVLKEQVFSPEFINRFDAAVVYTPLSEGHLREVTKMRLKDVNRKLASKGVQIKITDTLIKTITAKGYDPVFGARAIRRTIQTDIESVVAQKLLSGEVAEGSGAIIEI